MDPNQQQLLLTGGAKKEGTYVDEVFSTYLYKGTKPDGQSIVNGIKFGNSNAGNSVLFDDVGDYLEIPYTADLCLGNNDFTIECWAYYRGDFDSYDGLFGNWTGAGVDGYVLETVGSGATTDLEFYYYDDSNTFVGPVQGGQVTKNQWNHLCVCRSGNTIRVFVNGTMHGSGTSITTGIRNGSSEFTVGGRVAGAGWWNGYITDLRVTIGQALYTANFTPSTDPLTTTSQGATASNVKLLCCNKETVTGSTKTPGTITARGFNGPHAKPFGRFTATDGEGGMLWIKSRTNTYFHVLQDTVRGTGKVLKSNSSDGNMNASSYLGSFDNAGFSFNSGADNDVQNPNQDFVSWSFRKAPGFFDVVQYSGSASGVVKTVDHNLGCVPGCIIVKKISTDGNNWACYHRAMDGSNPQEYSLSWSTTNPRSTNTAVNYWGDFLPTSTQFKVGDSDTGMGDPSGQWIAYLFGGGESTNDQARSVRFDGNGDYLTIPKDSAWDFGAVDFTMECWVRFHTHNPHDGIIHNVENGGWGSGSWVFEPVNGVLNFYYYSTDGNIYGIAGAYIPLRSWTHLAITKSGSTITIYQDGIKTGKGTITGSIRDSGNNNTVIGGQCVGRDCNADISNLRVTRGQVLYTNSFTPSTKPLTTTSQGAVAGNVILLCCNQSTVTGSTVTTGTITSHGSTAANVMSPFDDPDCYQFGADGNENIIKCGSYGGTGATKGPEVYCGWEPQYVAIRCIRRPDGVGGGYYGSGWYILDSTRTIASGTNSGGNRGLQTQETNGEATESNINIQLTATGFKVGGQNIMNANDSNYGPGEYMYIAIRNNDAKVGKPPKVGLDVFAMDYGNASTTIPSYYSNFPVDLGLEKRYTETYDWWLSSRLTGSTYTRPSSPVTQSGPTSTWGTNYMFDSNLGYVAASWANNVTIAYMWKRYNGVDVVPYTGNGMASREIPHNLGVAPEMVWYKLRNANENWVVYNQYLNGGTNPGQWYLTLDTNDSENQSNIYFADTEPTAKYLTVNQSNRVNTNNNDYIAVLFASGTDADGNQISKCGAYDGSADSQTIQLGFKPQFLIVKRIDASSGWMVMDTKRGWSGSGNKDLIVLNSTGPQTTAYGYTGESVANGFTLNGGINETNANGCKYIYYAHA